MYLAPAADAHAVHHDAHAERLMNWSLVPLMVGSIVLGYARVTGSQSALAATLGGSETLPRPITPVGLLAFALGAGRLRRGLVVLRAADAARLGPSATVAIGPTAGSRAIAEAG